MRWKHSKYHDLSSDQFFALAESCAHEHDADLLLSGPGHAGESIHRIGLFPKQNLIVFPSTQLAEIKSFCFNSPQPSMGWISYELGMRLHGVESSKQSSLPQGHLKKYGATIEYDAQTGECLLKSMNKECFQAALIIVKKAVSQAPLSTYSSGPNLGHITSSLNRKEYEEGVAQTLEYIRDGQAYQLNLSIQFEQKSPALDSTALFFDLFHQYPAPFYALFTSGEHRILSTSPERFLKVTNGQVISQPIKGTYVIENDADNTADGEAAAHAALRNSDKESAELSMIVDLIRNDISHHCEYGSVRVENHRSIARVDNLLQMYSDVRGKLREKSTCLDLLLSALPGGSITGCPKRRAMELIDKLEPHGRGVYCGNFVYIEDKKNMDSSICIRTGVHDMKKETFTFHAGSGIVVDSDPASEYKETMAKAAKFLRGDDR